MGMVMGKTGSDKMARILGRLSAVRVQGVRERGYYGDGGGLYLRVAPGGAKGWIFRYGGRGPPRGTGLGGDAPVRPPQARGPASDRPPAPVPRPRPPSARHHESPPGGPPR